MSMPVVAFVRLFLSETLGSVIRFPFWWYTEGFFEAARWCARGLRFRWDSAGLKVWVSNLFVPMYGQYDLAGRFVSVIMRIIVLIGRMIGLIVEVFGYALILFAWVVLPALSMILFFDSAFRFMMAR